MSSRAGESGRTTRPQEVEAVLRLDGPKRFEHFAKRAADEEQVWGLRKDGWALMADDDGAQVFPLWPAKEYAEPCAIEVLAGYEASEIGLESLLGELLPKLAADGVRVGVFPTPSGQGVIVDPSVLEQALKAELENYE